MTRRGTPRLNSVLFGLTMAAAVGLVGCSSPSPKATVEPEKTKETPSGTTAPPSPSSTPTKPSDAQLEAELMKTVKGYWAANEEAYRRSDPSPLSKWSFINGCKLCKQTADLINEDKKKGRRYQEAGSYLVDDAELREGGRIPSMTFVLTTPPGKVVGRNGEVVQTVKTQKFKYVALFGKGSDGRWYIKYLTFTKLGR